MICWGEEGGGGEGRTGELDGFVVRHGCGGEGHLVQGGGAAYLEGDHLVGQEGGGEGGEGGEVGDLDDLGHVRGCGGGGVEGRDGDVGVRGLAEQGERGVEGVELGVVGAAAGDEGCLVDEEGGGGRVGDADGGEVEGGVVDAGLGDVWEADVDAVRVVSQCLVVRGDPVPCSWRQAGEKISG